MALSIIYKVLAGVAWMACAGVLSAATAHFTKALREAHLKLPADPRKYVQIWGPRMAADGTIAGRARLAGRPGKVSPQHAERAYEAALDYKAAGRKQPFASYKDLEANCPTWSGIMEECSASNRTLRVAVKKLHPEFGYHKLTPRHTLKRADKDARMAAALAGRDLSERYLQTTVFIDCKTTYAVGREAQHGICDASVDRSCPPTRQAVSGGESLRARFYGAVNALLGPVLLGFVTGTTGMVGGFNDKIYKVGSCTE